MVKYYGRARQRIGSVNTNQLGLKMSGCPSRVGRNPVIARYISQRVNCMNGTCGPIMIHGVSSDITKFRNLPPYCKNPVGKCQAAAGGIGNINTPYYRTPAPGELGCGSTLLPLKGTYTVEAAQNIDIITSFPEIGYLKSGSAACSYYAPGPCGGKLVGPKPSVGIQALGTAQVVAGSYGFIIVLDYVKGFNDEQNKPFSGINVTGKPGFSSYNVEAFNTIIPPPTSEQPTPQFVVYWTGALANVNTFTVGDSYKITFY